MSPLSKALFLVLFPLSFFSVFFHRCFPFLFARRAQSSLDHCPFWPAKCSREEPGNPATGPDNGDQILQVTVQAARSVYDPMRRIASAPRPRNYHRFLVLRNSAASTANAGVTVATAPQLSARKTGRMEYFALFFFTQFLDQIGRGQAGGTEDAIAVTSFSMERRSSLPMKCYSVPGEGKAQLPP